MDQLNAIGGVPVACLRPQLILLLLRISLTLPFNLI